MKHIFTIHSSLTFLVAYSVITHLKIPKKDVILISTKFSVPIEGFTVVPSYDEQNDSWWKKLFRLNTPKNYDKWIGKITKNQPFVAYVDLMSFYQKILITHSKCTTFNFIEEGNSAYMEYDDLADLTWNEYTKGIRFRVNLNSKETISNLIKVIRGFNIRLLSLPYHYMAYANFEKTRFFAFSRNAFFNINNSKRILVKPASDDYLIKSMAADISLNEEVIWIDGSNARYTGLPENFYYDAIEKAISKLKAMGIIKDKVYVKLRPGIKDISQNRLADLLSKNMIKVEVLPDNMVLECLFMNSQNCTVIGTLTAALEYAFVFGHRSYSIYSLFEQQPSTFFDRMSGFWENVKKL